MCPTFKETNYLKVIFSLSLSVCLSLSHTKNTHFTNTKTLIYTHTNARTYKQRHRKQNFRSGIWSLLKFPHLSFVFIFCIENMVWTSWGSSIANRKIDTNIQKKHYEVFRNLSFLMFYEHNCDSFQNPVDMLSTRFENSILLLDTFRAATCSKYELIFPIYLVLCQFLHPAFTVGDIWRNYLSYTNSLTLSLARTHTHTHTHITKTHTHSHTHRSLQLISEQFVANDFSSFWCFLTFFAFCLYLCLTLKITIFLRLNLFLSLFYSHTAYHKNMHTHS